MRAASFALTALMATLSLGACQVTVDQDFDESFDIEMDLPDEGCEGTFTQSSSTERGSGETTLTLTTNTEDDTCSIHFVWEGTLFDAKELAEKIENEAGGNVTDVTIDALSGEVSALDLVGHDGDVAPPAIESFDTTVKIEDAVFFTLDVENADDFLAQPVAFDAGQAVLDAFTAAIKDKDIITGSGEGTLTVSMAEFGRLAAIQHLAMNVDLKGQVTVTVTVGGGGAE